MKASSSPPDDTATLKLPDMAWFLSPSGWPITAESGSLLADRLLDGGWHLIDETQVAAAVTAYQAGTPGPTTPDDYVTDAELAAAVAGTHPVTILDNGDGTVTISIT